MKTYNITCENAREMQARGQAAKKAQVEQARATVKLISDTLEENHEDFRQTMLVKVRLQTARVLLAVDKELDKPTLDHRALGGLATTLSTFEAIEQKLSMRAGPGNLKPSAPRKARAGSFQPPPPADDDGAA